MRKAFAMVGRVGVLVMGALLCDSSWASAQTQIPPPSGPLLVCATHTGLPATSYQMVLTPPGGPAGAPESIAATSPADARCQPGTTHSFFVPAARFTLGTSTLQVLASGVGWGPNPGNVYSILVDVAGQMTITAVISTPPED